MMGVEKSQTVTVKTVRSIKLNDAELTEIIKEWAAGKYGLSLSETRVVFDVTRDEYLLGVEICEEVVSVDVKP